MSLENTRQNSRERRSESFQRLRDDVHVSGFMYPLDYEVSTKYFRMSLVSRGGCALKRQSRPGNSKRHIDSGGTTKHETPTCVTSVGPKDKKNCGLNCGLLDISCHFAPGPPTAQDGPKIYSSETKMAEDIVPCVSSPPGKARAIA